MNEIKSVNEALSWTQSKSFSRGRSTFTEFCTANALLRELGGEPARKFNFFFK